ncbi:MAG: aspartate--ammonia ligase [Oscillospiraceae bacterium]
MADKQLILPEGYDPKLDLFETQVAIKLVKDTFERELAKALDLIRVSAPLFVFPSTGLNDDLNGVERPVQFDILGLTEEVQIVQSLAKWKRMALHRYGFPPGKGLYTDMNAIRRDEDLDNLHSVYVDQWDWEKVIRREDRNEAYLMEAVNAIAGALYKTQDKLLEQFPGLTPMVPGREVYFTTTQALEDKYPELSGSQREDVVAKEHGIVFLMQIGGALKSGKRHDGRSPDYDDWNLNGDLIAWNPVLNRAFELSSMGIRVDAEALDRQLNAAGANDRRGMEFHRMLLADKLPLTIGGGIGQSRLCMLLLGKAHIGEVQVSAWSDEMADICAANGINLL